MVIKYRIRRVELVQAYFYNLQHSRRTRFIVLGFSAAIFAYNLFLGYRTHGQLTLSGVASALAFALGFVLAIPAIAFLTAKTQERTLAIDAAGIDTKIGNKAGTIPWKAVASVALVGDRILVTGKTANVFSIPASAFQSDEERVRFISLASGYQKSATE